MTKKERKRLSQRDEEGRLVYRIGQLGGTGKICGEIMAVEVKPRKGHPLKANQAVIMGLLADHGIPCYIWTPDCGLERMNGTE